MIIVHVSVHVKPEYISAFKDAVLDNARNSILEPGVFRFDVIQEQDDASRFLLVEVYRDAEAQASHKETAHYLRWRDKVAEMMAEPRPSKKYTAIFPGENGWE